MEKFKVTFLPGDHTCEATKGESLLEIAINNDIPLQHACGGFCSCTTCQVYVVEGKENLELMDEMEKERLEDTADQVTSESRLGCQARVKGPVVVKMVHPEY